MRVTGSPLGRAVLAFAALPGLVAFVVPVWLASNGGTASFCLAGLVPLLPGMGLLLWCVRDFYTAGQGTLAPWDPPRRLVSSGPYRVSRNPMYLAVILILAGWTLGFQSWRLLCYTAAVMVVFHLRVVFGEEPWLARAHRQEWTRYAARVPRWLFPSRKALLAALAGLAVLLPIAGLVYETYVEAGAAREFPPPGMLVDIGGRRLHLLCIGKGEPTVFFEASGFGVSAVAAAEVRERVAARTRVCSYDRIGMGWSDPGPGVLTAGELARQLAVLQDRADLRGPFLLVGSSVGGLTVEMFARRYPERTAGLVFLDASSSGAFPQVEQWFGVARAGAPVVTLAARLGLLHLSNPFRIATDTDAGRRSAAMTYSAASIGTLSAIVRGLADSQREFAEAPPLGRDLPLVVLSASDPRVLDVPGLARLGEGRKPARVDVDKRLAAQSDRGSWRMVPESTHLIAVSQPEAVVEAISKMLDEIG